MAVMPSAQYSVTLRVEHAHDPATLGRLTWSIGEAGGSIGAIDIVEPGGETVLRELTVDCANLDHSRQIVAAVDSVEGVRVIETTDRTLELHRGGKLFTGLQAPIKTRDDLSARGIASVVEDQELAEDYIVPSVFNRAVSRAVASAVAGEAERSGEARVPLQSAATS